MKAAFLAAGICIANAAVADVRSFAGVVLYQTIEQKRQGLPDSSQSETVSTQGSLQRVETDDGIVIYDLDRKLMIEIDKNKQTWRKIPLSKIAGQRIVPHYRKMAEKTTIAGYDCELHDVEHPGNEDIDERACYSTAIPGAAEITRFNRLMLKALANSRAHHLEFPPPGAELLSESSTFMPVLHVPPNLDAEQQKNIRAYIDEHPEVRGGKFVTTVRVDRVEQKRIPPSDFRPPPGFRNATRTDKQSRRRHKPVAEL